MNTKTKKTLLISGILILVVINISALSTIYYQNKIRSKKMEEMRSEQKDMHMRGMRRYIQEELNLSEEQYIQFRDIHSAYMISSQEIARELNNRRHEMMYELANDIPNNDQLDQIASEIGNLHYQLKKLTIHHFLELKEICSDDQQEDLQKLFMKLINEQDHPKKDRRPRERGRNQYKGRRGQNSH